MIRVHFWNFYWDILVKNIVAPSLKESGQMPNQSKYPKEKMWEIVWHYLRTFCTRYCKEDGASCEEYKFLNNLVKLWDSFVVWCLWWLEIFPTPFLRFSHPQIPPDCRLKPKRVVFYMTSTGRRDERLGERWVSKLQVLVCLIHNGNCFNLNIIHVVQQCCQKSDWFDTLEMMPEWYILRKFTVYI